MGLQDSLMTQVVAAHDVLKGKGNNSTMSAASSSGRMPNLENDLRDLGIGDGNNAGGGSDLDNGVNMADSNVPENDEQYAVDEDDYYDEDGIYDDDADDAESLTDEGRLSKVLQFWMPDYVITPLPRQAQPARQPVFSARLGRESSIQRSSSSESIETQLSLFSCSSHGSRVVRERKRRRRRKKTASADRERQQKPESAEGSRWVELAMRRRKGELDRFMMAQSQALMQNINLTGESEAFDLCDKDEQRALFRCGHMDKLAFAANLKKSDSMTNIKEPGPGKKPKQRIASASAKKSHGPPVDFHEVRRQMMNQRLASLSSHHRSSGRRSMHRSASRHSLTSVNSDVFLSATTPRTNTPPPKAEEPAEKKEQVTMWKGDRQILAIDLKKELTSKVKHRITTTTTALERVTGMGDDNEPRPYSCHLQEFPSYIDDDFALMPKIPQKIRISPQLSHVIKTDIQVRMGRPRYHEIRVRDLELWNRGQTLDRAHRNLKVFNWLHSLKEDEFDAASVQQTINDVPPDLEEVTFGEMVLIHAVDEPDVKPLFERKKQQYIR